ncbi:MAG: CoA-acylating methylmalonate-semialdehyde dehydrogenase [Cytophagales bacterium]|nr:CoA-acylating methylmalonate-semialdehyde dehydrogenase [Cytophagales bacterium]
MIKELERHPVVSTFKDFGTIKNWVDGKLIDAETSEFQDVNCPYNGEVLGQVPLSSTTDVDKAVQAAKNAYPGWKKIGIKSRAQFMFNLKKIIEDDLENFSTLAALENGKTIPEAKGEILRGLEVVEFASALPNKITGPKLETSAGVESSFTREPLGVVASITPFNFPAMIPLWTLPTILTTGSTMVLKPSEQTPLSALKLAEYIEQSGIPKGVFNIVNGGKEVVQSICEHSDIKAISFVGSTAVAKIVYQTAAQYTKRVLTLGGAKNHLVVLPDADLETSPANVIASAMGCAGQRCMAASTMLSVGDTDKLIDRMVENAKSIKLGTGMGAIINKQNLDRIVSYIEMAEKDGCKILVDGRGQTVEGMEGGYWLGPTIIDGVDPDAPYAKDEIFGPVLCIIRSNTMQEAVDIENASNYGNAASIFTNNGAAAKFWTDNASAGMIGINIGVPVPRDPFPFGGWNDSKFGANDLTGDSGVEFFTQNKKVTTRWVGTQQGFLE